jgi:hypothetical protein
VTPEKMKTTGVDREREKKRGMERQTEKETRFLTF